MFKNVLAIGLAAILAAASVPMDAYAEENIDSELMLTTEEENNPEEKGLAASEDGSGYESEDDAEEIGWVEEGSKDADEIGDDEEDADAENESSQNAEEPEDEEGIDDEEIIVDEEIEKADLLKDTPAPVLTGQSVWRTDASTATVKFHTDTAGTYYYVVNSSQNAPDADNIINGNTGTVVATAGMVKIENVAGLTTGEKYVHVVLVNGENGQSNVHTIYMPYDVYYFEDFESYDEDVYITQDGSPLSPITTSDSDQHYDEQKIVSRDDGVGKALQLLGVSGNASDQYIRLSDLGIPQRSLYVYEGKFNIDEAAADNGIRFSFMKEGGGNSAGDEAGIMTLDNHIYRHRKDKSYDFYTMENDAWYTVRIEALPSSNTYDLYIDNEHFENIPAPSNLDYLWFSAVWDVKAYFDDLKFYTVSPFAVTFDSNGGSSINTQYVFPGETATLPDPAPTKDNSSFVGWKLDGETYDFSTPVTEDITLVAEWEDASIKISGKSAWRTDDATASVKFHCNKAGTYYYKVTDSETAPSAADIKASAQASEAGTGTGSTVKGTVKIASVEGLESGAKYVHIVAYSGDLASNVHTIGLPYEAYYFDDFESYPEDTYIAQSGTPMSPLTQRKNGSSDDEQKVASNGDGGNMLQIKALSSDEATRSDHYVGLSSDMRNYSRDWVLEGDICLPEDGTGRQLLLVLGRWDYIKNGILVQGNKVYDGNGSQELGSFTVGSWHHVMIKAYPASDTYDVVLDGTTIGQGLTGNVKDVDQVWLSTGERDGSEEGLIAQFDNLKFYTVQNADGWVTSYAELQAALADENVTEVVVGNEILLPEGAVVDGHGKTVRVPEIYFNEDGTVNENASDFNIFRASETSAVIKNMTVMGGSQSAIIVRNRNHGNNMKVSNVTATRSSNGFENYYNSYLVLENCTAHNNAVGVRTTGTAETIMDNCSVTNNRDCGVLLDKINYTMAGWLYANNCVIADNGGYDSDAYGAGISAAATTGSDKRPARVYLTNCTITGNVMRTDNTSDVRAGGIGFNNSKLYAANCVIVDNVCVNDDGVVTGSDICMGWYRTLPELHLKSSVYGYIKKIDEDQGYTVDIAEDCVVDTTHSTASAYVREGVMTHDGISTPFKHPAKVERIDLEGAYYVPISGSGPAASGGVKTYYNYSAVNNIKMGYSDDGGVTITVMDRLNQPDSSQEVTTYYGGDIRMDGVIGACASDGITLKPVLTGRSVWRTNATTATIKFRSDSAGTYYYKISEEDQASSAEQVKSGCDGTGEAVDGINSIALSASELGSGARYVYIVVENSLLSDVHIIEMPYDVYYFEDFESYEPGMYITQDGEPLAPLTQINEGKGDAYQKVVYNSGVGNSLQLESSKENPSVISEQRIVLPEQMRSTGKLWVLESDFCVPVSGGGDQLILTFVDDDAEISDGIWIKGNSIYSGDKETYLAANTVGSRRHVVIKVYAWKNTYDIIVDNKVIGQGLTGSPTGVRAIRLSPGNDGNSYSSYVAQYDNLKYYTLDPVTVAFDSNGGSTVPAQYVLSGETATKPDDPTWENHIFNGWYLGTEQFDFATQITEDITLTAEWLTDGEINPQVKIDNWVYGQPANAPYLLEGSNPGGGAVTYEYKVKGADDSTYTGTVPSEAGNYTVRATIAAAGDYNAGVATYDFAVEKDNHEDIAQEDEVPSETATLDRAFGLAFIPEGASYAGTGTIGGSNPELINGTPTIEGRTLTYSTTAQPAGSSATITIRVVNALNFNDFNVTVTVTAKEEEEEVRDYIWLEEIAPQPFCGSQIKPVPVVHFRDKTLTAADYTVSYKNNVNAADKDAVNAKGVSIAPTIIVKGKGNYAGTASETFTITKLNMQNATAPDLYFTYNSRKAQYGKPKVTYDLNGKTLTLKENRDYTIEFSKTGDYKAPDRYPTLIRGMGNYEGSRYYEVIIAGQEETLLSKATVAAIPDQKYSGKKIIFSVMKDNPSDNETFALAKNGDQPFAFSVRYNRKELEYGEDKDYVILDIEQNKEIGTATVIIKGTGNVTENGSFVGYKTATFKIKGTALSSVKCDKPVNFTYDGGFHKQEPLLYTMSGTEKNYLTPNDDYTVDYKDASGHSVDPRKAGSYTVIYTGIGAYTGTVKKTYKINPFTETAATNGIKVTVSPGSYTYTKGGVKPGSVNTDEVTVKFVFGGRNVTLEKDTDYTLKWSNNNAVTTASTSKKPTVTAVLKGNFKGSKSAKFTITGSTLSAASVNVVTTDVVYAQKPGICKTTPTITDAVTGAKLVAGTDYEKTFKYTYAQTTHVKVKKTVNKKTVYSDEERAAGTEVNPKEDIIPAGYRINVTIKGKGNYFGTGEEAATITGSFYYVSKSLAKATVKIANKQFTGEPIELEEEDITVRFGNDDPLVLETDYVIVPGSYLKNTNKGTAKVTIAAVPGGNYGNRKTVSFKIVAKTMNYTIHYDNNKALLAQALYDKYGNGAEGGADAWFDANYRINGTMKDSSTARGAKVTKNAFVLQKKSATGKWVSSTDAVFTGWNTKENGSGNAIANQGVFSPTWIADLIFGEKYDLFAQWDVK
ncbi:MAG: InlB B-repeat-containing protein [Butyrivibrio sp.]|nr:InlB B-repeat-containing protein [Butyrivibrio sp.]